jgi:hypothetical protein
MNMTSNLDIIKSVRKKQLLSNIKCMTGICLLPIWVIYSWQTYFHAESSACWKAAYIGHEKVSMSVEQKLTCYLTVLYKLMASFRVNQTANRRSPSIWNRVNRLLSTDLPPSVKNSHGSTDRRITTHKAILYWNCKLQAIIRRCQGKGV